MSTAAVHTPLRIAIGLSGGVDSAVTALVLSRCVHTTADVAALHRLGGAHAQPPPLSALQAAIDARQPLHQLLRVRPPRSSSSSSGDGGRVLHDARPVHYTPVFVRCWQDESTSAGWCVRAQAEYDDAQRVARALELLPSDAAPLPLHDLSCAYAELCFQRMLDAFAAGDTLNVDVLCNSKVKFGELLRALHRVDAPSGAAPLLATGHYARTWVPPWCGVDGGASSALLVRPLTAGSDLNDQTVFLSRVPPSTLAHAVFPLGHLVACKADVRALAHSFFGRCGGGAAAHISCKKTSTGICFVGPPPRGAAVPSHFAGFLNEYIAPPPSSTAAPDRTRFRDATTGETLWWLEGAAEGRRHGSAGAALRADYPGCLPAYLLTLGQRVRLRRHSAAEHGGQVREAPYYVARKTLAPLPPATPGSDGVGVVRVLAEVDVVPVWDHPLLYSSRATVASLRWWLPPWVLHRCSTLCPERRVRRLRCHCCTRHQEPLQLATVEWAVADECVDGGDDGVRVRHARVHFAVAVRAIAVGQALVVYASLAALVQIAQPGDDPLPVHARPASAAAMAVIGSGWVASGEPPPHRP
ncbi:tRNA-methyl transferase [Novymonas esmeraldas]|uniref:tRNA-methyl transferase n=1 Tax=Novymonas esmeraldas TaxID=1808958 RepID=A0AAW0EK75_9TRYP